jgi:D-sedoheptulose 7-phosphate isomerase
MADIWNRDRDREGAMAALYPFLYADTSDLDSLLADVRRSTVEKVREITELRRTVEVRDGQRLAACAEDMARSFRTGGRLFAFGNGGSSTDAQALASLFLHPSARAGLDPAGTPPAPALPALALTGDIAVLTALSNDIGFDVVFSRQIAAHARPGDIAVGLSTSGNSVNLLRAFDTARGRDLLTVGIAGYDGGRMADLDSIDHLFVVPSPSVHRIQEAQTTIYHVLWELTVAAFEAEPEPAGHGQHRPDHAKG